VPLEEVAMPGFRQVPIPATRDPFINAQPTPAGFDRETGEERFWASTWNANSGCTAVLFTPTGRNRVYRFDPERAQYGFYGAAYAGDDVLWLSGWLDEIVRLDLATGETTAYATGLPHDLSASGMAYDPKTGKLFSETYCQDDFKRKAFSFDTRTGTVARTFEDLPLQNNQLRYGLANPDGTFTFASVIPDVELFTWDPADDSVEVVLENHHPAGSQQHDACVLVARPDGAVYVPYRGWFDPRRKTFVEGRTAPREATWFALRDGVAYGAEQTDSGNSVLLRWDVTTGASRTVAEIPDSTSYSFRMSRNGRIVCVNFYGYFYRVDPETSAIEASLKLDTDSVGRIDCLRRVDRRRLLCTPFITQRFYEIDLETGVGTDLGRATAGIGEVMETCELDGTIYMASYTKGQLVAYDPSAHVHFPENPRVVVHPPKTAMRPVGICTGDGTIFYNCTHVYGSRGSLLVRHAPARGTTRFQDDPVPDHAVRSLAYDEATRTLIAGTSYAADCNSCPPKDTTALLVRIDPETLGVLATYRGADHVYEYVLLGRLTETEYLFRADFDDGHAEWVALDGGTFAVRPVARPDFAGGAGVKVQAAGGAAPGRFVVENAGSIELWDLAVGAKVRTICEETGYARLYIQDGSLYFVYRKHIRILEDCL
jgi:hypothetical protein